MELQTVKQPPKSQKKTPYLLGKVCYSILRVRPQKLTKRTYILIEKEERHSSSSEKINLRLIVKKSLPIKHRPTELPRNIQIDFQTPSIEPFLGKINSKY